MEIKENSVYFISGADLREFALRIIYELRTNEQEEETEFVTVDEACKLLSISKPTLWRWGRNGTVTPIKKAGRVYYQKKELLKI